MKKKLLLIPICLSLLVAVPTFNGCVGPFKPVPVAEGHDPVVVHAERIQRSSLQIFRQVTVWEFNNRLSLPVEVSRAIDKYRTDFPPAWTESRAALQAYKAKTGPDATAIQRTTAALEIAQASLLKLRKEQSPNEATQAYNALSTLIASVRQLTTKPNP